MLFPATLKIYNASAGSGKTFFLVKNYLHILFKSPNADEFKSILALTFTNKASEEMKNRILECIKEFSKKNVNKKYYYLLNYLLKDLQLTHYQLRHRSKKILDEILKDFSSFTISTIDKFTYNIIRSFFSSEKKLEMDTNNFLYEIVRNILYKFKFSEKWYTILVELSLDKLKEGENWEVSKYLYNLTKIMIDENSFFPLKKIKNYSSYDLMKLKNTMVKRTIKFEKKCKEQGEIFFDILKKNSIKKESFIHLDLPRFFQKMKTGNIFFHPLNKRLEKYMRSNIFLSKNIRKKKNNNQIELIEINKKKILSLYHKTINIYENNISSYLIDKILLKDISIFSIIHEIEKEFYLLKDEKNIILNAELNKILHEKIIQGLFPRIYEMMGMKYKYYFIDEFQDTSFLQWQNIKFLVENALSENGSAMIVGDPKQSIYRWRGGDVNQFINLFNYKSKIYHIISQTIDINYRSFEKIVIFNNSFYKYVSKFFDSFMYRNIYKKSEQKIYKKHGGYVELNLFSKKKISDYKEHVYFELKKRINKFIHLNYLLSDIAILVRNNDEGNFLSEKLIKDKFFVNTSVSLLIKNYAEIQIIINFFYIISYPFHYNKRILFISILLSNEFFIKEINHDFIMKIVFLPLDIFFEEIFRLLKNSKELFSIKNILNHNKSIYDLSENIIEIFQLLNSKNNVSSIYSFLDFVYRFMKKKGNSIIDFLDYWELKKDKESIIVSDNTNAIHVITIHKSKGLQFPIVFIPFADWNIHSNNKEGEWIKVNPHLYHGISYFYLKIKPYYKSIKNSKIHHFYEKYISDIIFDNINLLYVSTTRSMEKLVLFSDIDNTKSVSSYIKGFLHEKEIWNEKKQKYSFGKEEKKIL
ncbi:UvrD-helicase domain-containing protein [Blattabacterium cuenoti]|uniref:UvrD-helicase domain-containing protein n=1 Tax=Blattabacterium cuenoti TaxID=1653831 RepID=UPI00163B7220|nr:UvrD-helicase domain-containing protein [Blattabacterium cuenoti]